MDENTKNLDTLRSLRVKQGLTQKDIAKYLGVSIATVSNLERDSTDIKDSILKKLLSLYDVDYNNIFLGKEYRKTVSLIAS